MSTLYLIRHGQASFGAADYDVLSELGIEQGRQLGLYWARRGPALDACYVGPRRRHVGTAESFARGVREAGKDYPEPHGLEGLDEYPAIELLKRWLPQLRAEDPEIDAAFQPGSDRRKFEQAFQGIVDKWSRGELDTGDLESYEAFRDRVSAALDDIMTREGRKKNIAVFTSGGPVSMALQRALGLSSHVALRASWVIANGSFSEFRYRSRDELTLVRFNSIPHFQDDSLITYR